MGEVGDAVGRDRHGVAVADGSGDRVGQIGVDGTTRSECRCDLVTCEPRGTGVGSLAVAVAGLRVDDPASTSGVVAHAVKTNTALTSPAASRAVRVVERP